MANVDTRHAFVALQDESLTDPKLVHGMIIHIYMSSKKSVTKIFRRVMSHSCVRF